MLHAVIMAGGSGTRFWPASRNAQPKQLLSLVGDRSMIQSTVDRIEKTISSDRTWIITNERLTQSISEQLPDLPIANVVGEPCKRDTAPCVGLAAAMIRQNDPDAILLMMPSDHVIKDSQGFAKAVSAGEKLIAEDPSRIVTFGIKPSYPAESFGYIQRGESPIDLSEHQDLNIRPVDRFREKPDAQTAKAYLDSGAFYWNSGIFMWRADTISSAIAKTQPEMMDRLDTIGKAFGTANFQNTLEDNFANVNSISIDYAVMESYDNVIVIEAPFDWDDVGSWVAMSRLHKQDEFNNTVVGKHLGIDTSGCIIRTTSDHTVATIGIDDLIIVQTPDATLVAPKSAEERVREIVQRLKDGESADLM